MGILWSQIFPSAPTFTEDNCPSLQGKVIVVTGATSGCGYELVKILYQKGATVYLSARSDAKGQKAVDEVKAAAPASSRSAGKVDYIVLEFDDLAKIKAGADAYRAKEQRIDVLFNNAGVATGAKGRRSAQDIDLHFAVNCLGPFLFTHYLMPEIRAGQDRRVVFSSSMIVDANPIEGGLVLSELDNPPSDHSRNYATSKVGNWFLASEFARRYEDAGLVSIAENPGNLKTPIWKDQSTAMMMAMNMILQPPKNGAYTMLYAGLSPDITTEHNGAFIVPWGKLHPSPRQDVLVAMKTKGDGGTGLAQEFWAWCEDKCKPYM